MSDKPNYTAYAALEPLNLIILTLLAIGLVMAVGVQGLGIAAVAEILYLILVPRMVPYKRRVDLKAQLKAIETRPAQRELRAAGLSRDVRRRYQAVVDVYRRVAEAPEKLPVGMGEVEDLMDAAVELSLVAEQHAEAERRSPLAQLEGDSAQSASLSERRRLAEHATAALAQLDQVEATLRHLQSLSAGARLEAGAGQAQVSQDIEATLRTAREMAAFDISRSA